MTNNENIDGTNGREPQVQEDASVREEDLKMEVEEGDDLLTAVDS